METQRGGWHPICTGLFPTLAEPLNPNLAALRPLYVKLQLFQRLYLLH